MGAPPAPPSRLVNPADYKRVQRENEANYARWRLKVQCFVLIAQDRRKEELNEH
jgi:hypothetical protein